MNALWKARGYTRVRKEDLPKLEEADAKCFSNDPLYCKPIPDQETRNG